MGPKRDSFPDDFVLVSKTKEVRAETKEKTEVVPPEKEVPKEIKAKDTLVIMCSGPGSMPKVMNFLQQNIGLAEADYDMLAVPGGIHSVMLSAFLPKFKWAVQRAVKFLVEEHRIKRIIVIDHDGCSWFKKIAVSEPVLIGARVVQHHAFKVALDCLAGQLKKDVTLEAWHISSVDKEVKFEKVK